MRPNHTFPKDVSRRLWTRRQWRQKRQEIRTKDTPPTTAPPAGEADDTAQKDYNLLIPSWKALPDNYERNNNNEKRTRNLRQGHSTHARSSRQRGRR